MICSLCGTVNLVNKYPPGVGKGEKDLLKKEMKGDKQMKGVLFEGNTRENDQATTIRPESEDLSEF